MEESTCRVGDSATLFAYNVLQGFGHGAASNFGGAFVGVLLLKELIKMKDGMEFLFSPAIEGVPSIVLFTLIGIGLYLLRRIKMAATQK